MNTKKNKPKVPQFTIPAWLQSHVAEARAWGPVDGEDTLCWVEGCGRSPHLHGLCRVHYFRAVRFWKRPGREYAGVVPASDEETTTNALEGSI